ncbi:Pol polyprotein [Smittium culicis]|uniref:Pol polyprotein n=1 Tax=Smittium culicis TaxID=133412 RepID=A0A1R1YJA0_9FUNG|nr:Pol polyprotein [Smittium culicis]
MSDASIQVTAEQLNNAEALLISKETEITEFRNQLIQGESQFQSAAEEHQEVLAKLEAKSKKNNELILQMTVMEKIMLKREMELVKLKADLYERISVLQSGTATHELAAGASGNAVKQISKLPVFEGKTIAYNRWINGVTEIFDNYTTLNDFQKRALVVESLKGPARDCVLQSGTATHELAAGASGNAVKQISKLPVFEGKTIAYNRWINGVTEIFDNYTTLNDFQKRALVVESLKGPARDWYDAVPDSKVADWNSFKEALNRQYRSLESTDKALERVDTLKLTLKSDFNSFIQQIKPSIKLIAGDNNTLAIAMLRKQVDPEIRKYAPKVANESFEEHEKRLKAHMNDSQAKFTSHSIRSNNMDIESFSTPIQVENDYAVAAAQYAPYSRQRQHVDNYQRNPCQLSRLPHNRENTTMTKEQFDEYFKNSICFNCGAKDERCSRRRLGKRPGSVIWSNSEPQLPKTPEPPDKYKYSLFAPQLPLQPMPADSIKPASLNKLNQYMNEDICFKLTANINSQPVTVLLDSGAQITSISESAANRLNLTFKNFKPLKLRMGNSSESTTTNKITTARICFGNTRYTTTFRVMPAQPFDVILGSNFIVATEVNYDPVKMTINFVQNQKVDSFSMVPSNCKITEWAPLILAAGALDCLPAADPDISAILRDVAELFNPTPSVIKIDFPHQLRLTTDQPCRARMRRYSPEETRILKEHIKELYQAGYARPSSSPYSSNPVIVPKTDGSSRVVINFRPLNKITIRDEYPLPRIDVILNQLFGCCFYTKLDILKAFYQIPLHPNSIEASEFSTPDGHHEFLIMPQGMSNSPATFQRNIDRTLRECIDAGYCAAFADDILVYSKSRNEHIQHLRSVLQKLNEKGFKANSKKCLFAVPKIEILGFTVSEKGQEISNSKIEAVKNFPRPNSVSTVRRFLGMVSFCRSFIDKFTEIASPLYKLLEKESGFKWNSDCETAFQRLITAMKTAPVLAHPDTTRSYIMYTDASNIVIGA